MFESGLIEVAENGKFDETQTALSSQSVTLLPLLEELGAVLRSSSGVPEGSPHSKTETPNTRNSKVSK
jgi:hypothetical protein